MSNGLGRGLSSLIPPRNLAGQKKEEDSSSGESLINKKDENRIFNVEISNINVNPMQPRKRFVDNSMEELVDSIKEYGIIQPLIATKEGDNYELIAGERRLRASKIAGLKKVPIILRNAQEQEKLEVALIENVQRENLNPVETAMAYRKLINEFNLSQEDVAKKVGKSRSSVTNVLRMLNLPEEIQLAMIEGKIFEGHAKYLVGLDSEVKQMALFRKIMHNNLSVNDTDKEAKRMGGTKAARIKINYADKNKEFFLREFFGAKTEIKRKRKGGQIIIDFFSDDELNEIIKKIQ